MKNYIHQVGHNIPPFPSLDDCNDCEANQADKSSPTLRRKPPKSRPENFAKEFDGLDLSLTLPTLSEDQLNCNKNNNSPVIHHKPQRLEKFAKQSDAMDHSTLSTPTLSTTSDDPRPINYKASKTIQNTRRKLPKSLRFAKQSDALDRSTLSTLSEDHLEHLAQTIGLDISFDRYNHKMILVDRLMKQEAQQKIRSNDDKSSNNDKSSSNDETRRVTRSMTSSSKSSSSKTSIKPISTKSATTMPPLDLLAIAMRVGVLELKESFAIFENGLERHHYKFNNDGISEYQEIFEEISPRMVVSLQSLEDASEVIRKCIALNKTIAECLVRAESSRFFDDETSVRAFCIQHLVLVNSHAYEVRSLVERALSAPIEAKWKETNNDNEIQAATFVLNDLTYSLQESQTETNSLLTILWSQKLPTERLTPKRLYNNKRPKDVPEQFSVPNPLAKKAKIVPACVHSS